MREANRTRKRRLLSIAEADPQFVAPALALVRALDAAYQGSDGQADEPMLLKQLAKAYHSLGLDTLAERAAGGGDR